MKSYVKAYSFGVAVVFAMMVSLIAPIHAVADDATPPPPVQTEATPPIETEAPPPADEVQTEEPSVIETEPPTLTEGEAAGDETTNSQEIELGSAQEINQDTGEVSNEIPQNISEIIGQLPEETGIHLETEDGIEPLVTPQAENLILVGDPIWCPAAVTDPFPSTNGCSISYPDLADFVNNFPDPGAPGVIWITEGTDLSASFISLDGTNYANWDSHDLVIQGGWNGAPLGGVISSATTINVPLEIINWAGNITINDIIITGAAGTGLSVDIAGDVHLNDLETTNNDASGLYVNSAGLVTADDIVSNNNGFASLSGYGAEIHGSEFQLTGTNEFNGNYDSGLYVATTGSIVTNNLTASGNGSLGGFAAGAELYSTSGNVSLLVGNQFENNLNTGLQIVALNGAISAVNVTSHNNGIGASYAPGAELFASSLTLSGNNVFTENNDTGLYAVVSGDISLSNINASNNGRPGMYGPGAELQSSGAVTITGNNVFSDNSSEGLVVLAGGNISVINFDALNNGGSGLSFVTTGADAYAECGSVLNNGGLQIDAALAGGTLTLAGVDFGGNPDLNVSASQLTLVSNICFNYPYYYSEGYNGFEGSGGASGANNTGKPPYSVKYVSLIEGQNVDLNCDFFNSTYILLEDGDGAIIPCPIVGSAKLDKIEETNPYGIFPDANKFISGVDLTISGEEQIFAPVDDVSNIIWYFNGASDESGGYEMVYWDGSDWVDVTDHIPPFLTIFFLVPEEFNHQDLAILYWDGSNWIELSNNTHLGQGRIVRGLGYRRTGEYFQVNVNFTGVFVLVEK